MIKKVFFFVFLLTSGFSFSQDFEQEDVKTRVRFKIKNFGINVDGQFRDVNIQTNFNSNDLSKSYIKATIAVKSITTGIESRDKHILEEDYFDEPNYKNIVLTSSKIEKDDDGTFQVYANLTIKGIDKPMVIPIIVTESNSQVTIIANFEINRKDFKVGGGSLVMGKNVKIQVEYAGTK